MVCVLIVSKNLKRGTSLDPPNMKSKVRFLYASKLL